MPTRIAPTARRTAHRCRRRKAHTRSRRGNRAKQTEARALCSWGREAHGGRARYDIRHYALALMAKRRSSRQHHGFVRVRDDRRGGRAEVAGQDLHIGRTMSEDKFAAVRSEEHTSELQSLMRISYAVFCLTQK